MMEKSKLELDQSEIDGILKCEVLEITGVKYIEYHKVADMLTKFADQQCQPLLNQIETQNGLLEDWKKDQAFKIENIQHLQSLIENKNAYIETLELRHEKR